MVREFRGVPPARNSKEMMRARGRYKKLQTIDEVKFLQGP